MKPTLVITPDYISEKGLCHIHLLAFNLNANIRFGSDLWDVSEGNRVVRMYCSELGVTLSRHPRYTVWKVYGKEHGLMGMYYPSERKYLWVKGEVPKIISTVTSTVITKD